MPRTLPKTETCVLYDPADGSIHLAHTVVLFSGAKAASWKAIEREAREILSSNKRDRPGLKSLRVRANALTPDSAYRVVRGKLTRTP
jgi:hypothetical protein